MADDNSASVISLHQSRPKRAKTAAERGLAFRQRKREAVVKQAQLPAVFEADTALSNVMPAFANGPNAGRTPVERRPAAPILLTVAALALAVVGMTMNGWFARSLGSTDTAGWLFLVIGVAADLVALVMPSCAAGLWQAGQQPTALAGWAVWFMTFVFAVTAGIGFASLNITDVTMARASRATPAVTTAQAALNDAMAGRDRECKGGVGKFCREREAAVTERRQAVDAAMGTVAATADPQTEAASRIVAWVSRGVLQPTGDDFAMLRLVLLALLPQIGGILLMVGRVNRRAGGFD